MPEWIEKNYKAWAASIGTAVAVVIYTQVQKWFPAIATTDLQAAIATITGGIAAMAFNFAFTWVWPMNKPTVGALTAAGAADAKVKTAITSAATKLADVTAVRK